MSTNTTEASRYQQLRGHLAYLKLATAADTLTGVEVRAALADDDLTRVDELAAEALDAESLGVAVATVTGRGRTLLVCHVSSPSVSSSGRQASIAVTRIWVEC